MNLACERLIVPGLLAVACWLWISAASGQSGKRLEGRILDPAGGGIPAKVTLVSDDQVRTTTADDNGKFVFANLTGPVHYVEASSTGFRSSSISITDSVPEPISITLQVGSCTICPSQMQVDVRNHSVYYEERSGKEQLIGSVSEFSGPPLRNAYLKLMKADLAAEAKWPDPGSSPSMNERRFRFVNVAQTFSNEKGEFQFAGLEPGWYSLTVGPAGYYDEIVKFWIARETLTRPARIELVREGPGQPSPFRSVFGEIPLTPARFPDIPLIPASQ